MRNQILARLHPDRGGVLLIGPKGLGQEEDALELASRVLGEGTENHPDLLILRQEGGFKVSDLEPVYEKLSIRPARAERTVIVIDGMERANEATQNKLLKALEESDAFFILLAYGAGVLPTIQSRALVVEYRPVSEQEYVSRYGDLASFYAAKGCPGADVPEEVPEIFGKCADALLAGDVRGLLNGLHLSKEKDKECFYEVFKAYAEPLFFYLARRLCGAGRVSEMDAAIKAAGRCGYQSYTNADFFADVVSLIDWESK